MCESIVGTNVQGDSAAAQSTNKRGTSKMFPRVHVVVLSKTTQP